MTVNEHKGQGYEFSYNDNTGLGEMTVNGHDIPLIEADALRFHEADEAGRKALCIQHLQVREALAAARKRGARA